MCNIPSRPLLLVYLSHCRSFELPYEPFGTLIDRTLYMDLDLISEEEFVAQHPEYVGLEGHELMLKRLEDEAQQRIELEMKRKDLVNRRTQMQADSKKRKNDLDQLTETLRKFIEVPPTDLPFLTYSECHTHIGSVSKVLDGILETKKFVYSGSIMIV